MPFDEGPRSSHDLRHVYYALKDRGPHEAGRQPCWCWGAAGGVGLAAVELGKAMGGRVIAAGLVAGEGRPGAGPTAPSSGVVYPLGPFDRDGQKALADSFKQPVGPNGVDWSTTGVGGRLTPRRRFGRWPGRAGSWWSASRPVSRGRRSSLGCPEGLRHRRPCSGAARFPRDPVAHQQNVAELLDLTPPARSSPHISEHFPLARAAEAITHLASRKAMGKVVVMVD